MGARKALQRTISEKLPPGFMRIFDPQSPIELPSLVRKGLSACVGLSQQFRAVFQG
jgi:hypothetical protein